MVERQMIEDKLRTSRTQEAWLPAAGKSARAISQSTTSIEAVRHTVDSIYELCGAASVWVEITPPNDADALIVASAGEIPSGMDSEYGRASYPLNIEMPAWRTARMVIRQSSEHIGSTTRSSRMAALLTILDNSIARIGESDGNMLISPEDHALVVAEETRFLEDLQDLTTAVSTATDLAHLCEMAHETVRRFIPADRFIVRANRPFATGADVFTAGELPPGMLAATIEAEMVTNDGPIGLIQVQRVHDSGFDFHHEAILEAIAQSICGAFERQILLDWAALQTRQETALRAAAEQFNQIQDPDDLLKVAGNMVFEAGSADTVLVTLVEPATRISKRRFARFRTVERDLPPIGSRINKDSLVVSALNSMQTIAIHESNTSDIPTFQAEPWKHFVAGAVVPFMVNDTISGFIFSGYTERSEMVDVDGAFAEQVGAMLATSMANAFANLERLQHTRDLGELQQLSTRISEALDLEQSLEAIVQSAVNLVQADGGVIGTVSNGEVIVHTVIGSVKGGLPLAFPIAGTLIEEVLTSGEPRILNDMINDWPRINPEAPIVSMATSAIIIPLIDHENEPVGVVGVFASEQRTWAEREAALLLALSATSAIAIQNARQFERTRDLLRASIESLAAAVEAKDPGTQNHSRNVAAYARIIAAEMGLEPELVDSIELAALLHDVGKIGIPDSVLDKPGKLDAVDWAAIQLHPVIGEQILSGNPELEHLLPMVRHHHERWDGHGYPDRLIGPQIPVGASVVSVAETLDALTTDRPYHAAINWRDAFDEIRSEQGRQFSPPVVDAFIAAYRKGKFPSLPHEVTTGSLMRPARERNRAPSLDVRALRIFESVALEIRGGADLRTFLMNVVDALREILGFGYLSVFTLEQEDAPLQLMASYPPVSDEEAFMRPIREGRGNVNWVARTGAIVNIPDVSQDERYLDGKLFSGGSELCVPLLADGRVVGVMNLESERLDAFSEADERLMISASDYIATAINVVQLHERLKNRSTTDALTGLANHRVFYDQLVAETRRSQLEDRQLSVAILDINNLKAINDSYGHLVGDAALRAAAAVLQRLRRPDDVVSRYGGDEFAIIMPQTSSDEAWELVETIAAALEAGEFETEGIVLPLPTTSWGIATTPDDGRRSIELLAIADERMYIHKNQTRS